MGELALPSGVPVREGSLEFLGDETATVDLYGGPGDTLGGNRVGQGRESEFVGEEGVSPVSEKPETLGNAVTVSEGQSDHMVLRRMEDVDESRQRFERGCDASAGTVGKGSLERERARTISVGDGLGGTRAVAPFENGIDAAESSDLELDLPDRVKTNVGIA